MNISGNTHSPKMRKIIESRFLVGKFKDYNQYANDHVLLGDLGSNRKK